MAALAVVFAGGPAAPAPCPSFSASSVEVDVTSTSVTEASGLAVSRANPGVIWTHNDSGDSARVFALNAATGARFATYDLTGATATDWEDMALGPGPLAGVDYLYLADIGDNAEARASIRVYRVPEPDVDPAGSGQNLPLSGWVALDMNYPDGPHNAETLFVDPRNADLYVVTKTSTGASRVFRYPFPHSDAAPVTLTEVATVSLADQGSLGRLVTGGDMSADGTLIALRTYTSVWGWVVDPAQSVAAALAGPRCAFPAPPEVQGETVAFDGEAAAYFTLAEGSMQPIYRHDRLLCPQGPQSCPAAGRSTLMLRDSGDDTRDKLTFRWSKGPIAEVGAFGDPAAQTAAAVCVYVNGTLAGSATVPPGTGWSSAARSFRFRDPAAANDGIRTLKLKAGEAGSPAPASVTVVGRGAVPLPALPLTTPVAISVQVTTEAGCWGTDFSDAEVTRNDAAGFGARR